MSHAAWKHNLFPCDFIYVTGLCVYLWLIKSVGLCSFNVCRKSTTTGSFELDVAVKSKSLKIPTIHVDASFLPDQKYGVNCLCCELAACTDGSLLGMLTYVAPDLWEYAEFVESLHMVWIMSELRHLRMCTIHHHVVLMLVQTSAIRKLYSYVVSVCHCNKIVKH